MSLETKVSELTTAVIALTAALAAAGGVPSNVTDIAAGKTEEKPATKTAEKTKPAAAGGGNAASLAKARAAKAAADKAKKEQEELDLLGGAEEEATDSVTIEQLRAVGMKLIKAKKGQELKDALNESFGVESLTSLDESSYADALAIIEGLLE